MNDTVKVGDVFYYAQVMPTLSRFNLIELKVRNVNYEDEWFSCVEKRDRYAMLFDFSDIDKVVFRDRQDALEIVLREEDRWKGE